MENSSNENKLTVIIKQIFDYTYSVPIVKMKIM